MRQKAMVIGAGIVGLATARALALKGFSVTVIEKDQKATGASVRNFGMIWPIGQPAGKLYDRAVRSQEIWKHIAATADLWYEESGSVHLAYHADEWQVLNELYHVFNNASRPVQLMNAANIGASFPSVKKDKLIGGLFSAAEMVVDPREALIKIPAYLRESHDIKFVWGAIVTRVSSNKIFFDEQSLQADVIFICSGSNFETLYPEYFRQINITKCKLQMMRFKSADNNFKLGPSLCGGLSLIHYKSFLQAPSLSLLQQRYAAEMPEYIKHGIHVMVSQNEWGELTVGDSHEYGLSPDPFDRADINDLIVSYLNQFVNASQWQLLETWNGVYPKLLNGDTEVIIKPEAGIYILNGLGGGGMTLSFGLAEEVVAGI